MDNRTLLESVIQDFSPDNLTNFFRAACGNFRPVDRDYSHYLKPDLPIEELNQIGQIQFPDERRLIVVVGQMETELTSRSGKKDQYDLAKKILKDELYDAGIFAFFDHQGNFRFSLVVVHYHGQRRTFSNYRRYTYFVSPHTPNRTFLDQIGTASFESIDAVLEAFSVEVVTKEFFQIYEQIFREAEASISLDWDAEQKRLYTQRFFNRLMFLAFLERKGWLIFDERSDYLLAMFEDYWHHDPDKRPQANFHRKRLNALFFWGLNNPRGDERDRKGYESLRDLIGQVPYLNGGLFEREADDETWFFPDEIAAKILKDLVYRFNFTVAESTPMDVEVAVDPEMLGKIFEELVTGRHESGSYYTPKPVVSFMCREAIKGYLKTALSNEQAEAVERFVDETDPADLRDPEAALTALRSVKACDPACGSGAYLLGLLHELLDLRAALFVSRNVDAQTVYERKLEIIQNNLYGVDIDPFAVNIARLRLWLSLIVDYEGDDPPPLPNLDFKIEAGDSLTAPDPSGGLQPDLFRYNQVQRFLRLKNEFMTAHSGSEEKRALAEEIESLRDEIAAWAHPDGADGFDWVVDFAEIFAPQLAEGTLGGKFTGVINAVPGQMELFERKREGGFDIVLTNPPYVRQELITRELGADYKEHLKDLYPHAYVGTADLYIAFYARAHQLLRSGGVGCFISSNKWLRAGYGENLRQHLLDKQAFHLVVDFEDASIFEAIAYPSIFLWQKLSRDSFTKWAVVKELEACYSEGILNHIQKIGVDVPSNQFGKGKPRLAHPETAQKQLSMESSGPRLVEYVDGNIFSGIKTGLNAAFVIDKDAYHELISLDERNKEILMPLLRGEDLRRYEAHFHENYLILTKIGVNIEKYPAVFDYLCKFKEKAQKRYDQGHHWWELRSCDYYESFNKPKIIYGEIAPRARFSMDKKGYYLLNTSYLIPVEDWYILGVLNSQPVDWYFRQIGAMIQNGYLRFIRQYVENIPIPDVSQDKREVVAKLTHQTQRLHNQRRERVEQFLVAIGTSPAETSSRNSLGKPWLLDEDDFMSRARRYGTPNPRVFHHARDETMALTEQIEEIEDEIDARVASLYGLY